MMLGWCARRAFVWAVIVTLASAWTGTARAAERVALLIGNGAYADADPLLTPVRDVQEVGRALREVGFTVEIRSDLEAHEMWSAIREFGDKVEQADAALFYFSGYGVQRDRINYLIPVDATLQDPIDLPIYAISVNEALFFLRDGGSNLVFIDASRANPLREAAGGIELKDGLAPILHTDGIFVASAAGPDGVSAETGGNLSAFANALAEHIPTPGLDLDELMTNVKFEVLQSTGSRQPIWFRNELDDPFLFTGTASPNAGPEPQDTGPQPRDARPEPQPQPQPQPEPQPQVARADAALDPPARVDDALDQRARADAGLDPAARDAVEPASETADAETGASDDEPIADAPGRREQPASIDLLVWESLASSSEKGDFETFVRLYPDSSKVPDARARIEEFERQLAEPRQVVEERELADGRSPEQDREPQPPGEAAPAPARQREAVIGSAAQAAPATSQTPDAGRVVEPAPQPEEPGFDTVMWERIATSDNRRDFELFVDLFPDSERAPDARARLDELDQPAVEAAAAAGATAEPAPQDALPRSLQAPQLASSTPADTNEPERAQPAAPVADEEEDVARLEQPERFDPFVVDVPLPLFEPEPEPEPVEPLDQPMFITASTVANVRSGPSTDFERIDALPDATEVQAIGINDAGDWHKVRLADGREGWIASFLVSEEPPVPPGLVAGEVFRDCAECPPMVAVPDGSLVVEVDGLFRTITAPQPLAVGRFEVTQGQWLACVRAGGCNGYRPDDEGWNELDRPVVNVSYDDARDYVAWLSGRTGEDYRLPSDAEWTYAARAAADVQARPWRRPADACALANVHDETSAAVNRFRWASFPCSDGHAQASPVGVFAANPFGLHDVIGNVWEWTSSCADEALGEVAGAASVRAGCTQRTLRGGGWRDRVSDVGYDARVAGRVGGRTAVDGFRVFRTLDEGIRAPGESAIAEAR